MLDKIAWLSVTPTTIAKCFQHCGLRVEDEDEDETDSDPFSELDELVQEIGDEELLTAAKYISAEEELATRQLWNEEENWKQELREVVLTDEH